MKVLMVQAGESFMLRGTNYPVCRELMFSSTWLKNKGFEIQIYNRCIQRQSVKSVLKTFAARYAVVFVAHSSSIRDAVKVSRQLKQSGVCVIWADAIPVLCEDYIQHFSCYDYILTGEYCIALQNLLEVMQHSGSVQNVRGIAYREKGKPVHTPPQPLQDLAALPAVDWSLIDVQKCFRVFPGCKKMLYLCASVGCPMGCEFCYATVCYRNVRRKRPIERVIEEIEYLVVNHGLDGLNFSDELFAFTDEELEKIKACRTRLNDAFIWGGETRAQFLTKEKLERLYDAGCRWLLFGLETGSLRMRALLHKEYDSDYIRKVVSWCTQIGIATHGSFIIGFQGETEQDLSDTVSFAKSLDLDAWLFNYLIPVDSTGVYNRLKQAGYFDGLDVYGYERLLSPDSYPVNYSAVPRKELGVIKAYFDWKTIRNKKNNKTRQAQFEMFYKVLDMVVQYIKAGPKDMVLGFFSIISRGVSVMIPLFYPKIVKKYKLKDDT